MVGCKANHISRSLLRPALFALLRSPFTRAASTVSTTVLPPNHTHSAVRADIIPEAPWSPIGLPPNASDRFDWRLRASSRRKPPVTKPPVKGQRRKYIKRIHPQEHDLHPGEPFYEETRIYRNQFLRLIEEEEAEEENVFKQRLAAWPIEKLKRNGYCLTELSAFWLEERHYGLRVASFSLGPGISLPSQHRFDKGTQVLVSRLDPLKDPPIRGSVLSVSETDLRVTFEDEFRIDEHNWRLDLATTNIVYDRMRAAIRALDADPSLLDAGVGDEIVIQKGTYLRDVLLSSFGSSYAPQPWKSHAGAFARDQRIQSWVKRHLLPTPIQVEGDPELRDMNVAQTRAIATMLGERLSLVQGPPGTGKTRTIIETLRLLKGHFEVPHPVLVCTYTNVAVDHLVEGLAAAGLKPLRFGSVQRVPPALLQHTLEHKLQAHSLHQRYKQAVDEGHAIEKQVKHHAALVRDNSHDDTKRTRYLAVMASAEERLSVVRKMAYAIRRTIIEEILNQSDVVCTTCISSASRTLDAVDFPVVFLDEASMSTEPASLIPLMKGAQHVAFIGDHKQLPPVVTSQKAQSSGLAVSLFERLIAERIVPSVMLNTQYRMHPSLARFPSSEFYDDLLLDGVADDNGMIPDRLSPPASRLLRSAPTQAGTTSRPSVVFLDHGGNESESDRSRVNWNEAHIVCSIIEDLLIHNEHLTGADIGVIAPYAAQVSLLKRLLGRDAGYEDRFKTTLGPHRAHQTTCVEVSTVDGFEGREKEVIIFSTVRNNTRGQLGFLADPRRLNVGLTRAKRGLFVVGSLHTLRAGRVTRPAADVVAEDLAKSGGQIQGVEAWRRYVELLTEQRAVMPLNGLVLAEVLYGNLPRHYRQNYTRERASYD